MADPDKERKLIEEKRKIKISTKMEPEDSRSEIAAFSYQAREKGCRKAFLEICGLILNFCFLKFVRKFAFVSFLKR